MNLKKNVRVLCFVLSIAGMLFSSLAFPGGPRLPQKDSQSAAQQLGPNPGKDPLVFALCVTSEAQEKKARVLVDRIRRFGGPYSRAPIYVVVDHPASLPCISLKERGVKLLALDMDEAARDYPFAHKVYASALESKNSPKN